MKLTKTDFLEYLRCDKCLWLKKRDPESYSSVPPTDFEQKNLREGQEVETYARNLFEGGVFVDGQLERAIKRTNVLIAKRRHPIFQATFTTENGLLVKVDILQFNSDSKLWDLYEVKSSTKIKTDRKHNHIKDVAFQKIAIEEFGLPIGEIFIIHLNGEYKKEGKLDISTLFQKVNVTEDVAKALEITKQEIDEALALIGKEEIDRSSCSCLYLSRPNHCTCFDVFNPSVPNYSVHDISRIRPEKIKALVDSGVLDISDVSESFDITENQRNQVSVAQLSDPQINESKIKSALAELVYPLHFIDYETYASAIPVLDGLSPHQHMPFQVSIHTLEADRGTLSHAEYIANDIPEAIPGFIEFLINNVRPNGSMISWHKSFENGINKRVAELYPSHSDFLLDLNARTFDLEVPFKKDYLHEGFRGKTSIKNILPIVAPELSYEALNIQDGASAMEAWRQMVFDDLPDEECLQIKSDLLEYCKMDTMGMVEILRHLRQFC